MQYQTMPDSAVFVVNGRTVASGIKWDGQEARLAITGEKIQDVIRRVDRATFFKDGVPVDCSFAGSR